MIDDTSKQKLIRDLEKSGNVYLACVKNGIARATYYRWLADDPKFKKQAQVAIRIGRENNCDVAEHSLMINVKEKKMDAIKYVLSHNSPKYKPKRDSKVVLEHRSIKEKVAPPVTLEDVLRGMAIRSLEAKRQRRAEEEAKHREDWDNALPPNPDGTRMMPWQKLENEALIKEWREKRGPYVPLPPAEDDDEDD